MRLPSKEFLFLQITETAARKPVQSGNTRRNAALLTETLAVSSTSPRLRGEVGLHRKMQSG